MMLRSNFSGREISLAKWKLFESWKEDPPFECWGCFTSAETLCIVEKEKTDPSNKELPWFELSLCPECSRKYLRPDEIKIIQSLKKIKKDESRPMNLDCIIFCHANSLISDDERSFLAKTRDKRTLSQWDELYKRMYINKRVLFFMKTDLIG